MCSAPIAPSEQQPDRQHSRSITGYHAIHSTPASASVCFRNYHSETSGRHENSLAVSTESLARLSRVGGGERPAGSACQLRNFARCHSPPRDARQLYVISGISSVLPCALYYPYSATFFRHTHRFITSLSHAICLSVMNGEFALRFRISSNPCALLLASSKDILQR